MHFIGPLTERTERGSDSVELDLLELGLLGVLGGAGVQEVVGSEYA
jgi:hypothetical protein